MEEHGATVALLRRREAELSSVEKLVSEARDAADALQAEVQALKEKVARREQRAHLAEREASFLQALVVSILPSSMSVSHCLIPGQLHCRRISCTRVASYG